MNELYSYIISGFVLLALPFVFVAGFWLRGFFIPYMRARGSQGKKIFIFAWNITRFEFPLGVLKEGMLYFVHNKVVHRINVEGEDFFRFLRVNAVMVNLKDGSVIRRTGKVMPGYDPVKTDSLITRALMKPGDQSLILIVILVAVLLIVALLLGNMFLTYQALNILKEGGQAVTTGIIGGV